MLAKLLRTASNQESQDIFVDDDPALLLHSGNKSELVEDAFQQDIKSEKLQYLVQILTELRTISNTIGEPMITYLLQMAILETDTALNVKDFSEDFPRKAIQMKGQE